MIPAISACSPQGHKSQARPLTQSKPVMFMALTREQEKAIKFMHKAMLSPIPGAKLAAVVRGTLAFDPAARETVRKGVEIGKKVVKAGRVVANVVSVVSGDIDAVERLRDLARK